MVLLIGVSFFIPSVPVTILAFVYLVFITIGWVTYGVMFWLVMRVPLLLVLPTALKTLGIAAALNACFISYGILKEMLVTQDHINSSLLVLSSRGMSIICSAGYLLLTEGRVSFGASFFDMCYFSVTNEGSTWAGYEMLKYVSFPLQVMAKSCKMLPNMIMGRIVNKQHYSFYQYAQAVGALLCVAIMHFTSDSEGATGQGKKGKKEVPEDMMSTNQKLAMGVGMLVIFFACDSFTTNWQNRLYKKYGSELSQVKMMYAGNLIGLLVTSTTLFASWSKVSASIKVAMDDPAIMWRISLLGLVAALGQFCIYSAIKILGSLSFTWIMTARQLMSVLISLVFFGHGISIIKLVCILTVFAIMSAKQLSKVSQIMPDPKELHRSFSKASSKLTKRLSSTNMLQNMRFASSTMKLE
jgi:adenosine 3'-phospho 5'-phosphosulfate transporter B2